MAVRLPGNRRGEIWWADLPSPAGSRPVLLLSRDEAYAVRSMVTVAPVTSRIRGIRSEVALGPNEGLPRPCAVNLDSITTINRQELRDLITLLDRPKMREVDAAIQFALGLDEGL